MDDVRRIAQELRPEALDHLGLASALTHLSRTFAERTGIAVRRRFDASLPPLDPYVELVVYRVAQESLTNAARAQRCERGRARRSSGTTTASCCAWSTTGAASAAARRGRGPARHPRARADRRRHGGDQARGAQAASRCGCASPALRARS